MTSSIKATSILLIALAAATVAGCSKHEGADGEATEPAAAESQPISGDATAAADSAAAVEAAMAASPSAVPVQAASSAAPAPASEPAAH